MRSPPRRPARAARLSRRYVAWAAATRSPDDPALRLRPFAPAAAPEIVGIAFCFHYINRMVAIFLAPSPLPFESPRLKALTRRLHRARS